MVVDPSECPSNSCTVRMSGAGFHADEARRQRSDEFEQFGSRHSDPNQGGLACGVHTMNSKDVLGEIDSDGDNGSHGLPLPRKRVS